MARFRKKPVVIDAVRFDGSARSSNLILEWIGTNGQQARNFRGKLIIDTLEGSMSADMGDWIIRGVQGEFYPCKPDIFTATYEPADG